MTKITWKTERRYRKRYPTGTRAEKRCLECGKIMMVIMSLRSRKKFCSKKCSLKSQSKRMAKFNPFKKGTKLIKTVNNVSYIHLNNSPKIVKIDSEDYEKIKQYSWRLHKNHDNRGYRRIQNLYAVARRFKGEKPKNILMHRFILGIERESARDSERQVDHINHNGLDNRKINLRIVTQSQNNQNRRRGCHGKYPNVRWNNITGKFYVQIKIEKKVIKLGNNFNTPDEALKSYNRIRKKFLKIGTLAIKT